MTRAILLAALAAFTVGCTSSGSDSSALAALTAPTSPATVETFMGTVAVGGTDVHTFMVITASQPVLVTLTAAGPPATISMGLGVGQPATDGSCSLFSNAAVATPAGTTAQLSGTIAPGSYCVSVFDIGNQAAPVDYTVTVSHY